MTAPGVTAAPLITAHFVVGPPRLPVDIVDRLAAAAQQAAQSAEFRQEMERLLIVGKVRSPAEARELMQQFHRVSLRWHRRDVSVDVLGH